MLHVTQSQHRYKWRALYWIFEFWVWLVVLRLEGVWFVMPVQFSFMMKWIEGCDVVWIGCYLCFPQGPTPCPHRWRWGQSNKTHDIIGATVYMYMYLWTTSICRHVVWCDEWLKERVRVGGREMDIGGCGAFLIVLFLCASNHCPFLLYHISIHGKIHSFNSPAV